MAIALNNVQNVSFLRNQTLFQTRLEAIEALQSAKANALDGTALLARYKEDGDTEVTTLVGYVYVSGETKDVTIFDVEGAEASVQALREEINAKLGNITSANTVSNQLAALSGTPGASSADTSVEGAKSYADAKIDEAITDLDYTGVTTGDGVYVTNVTEVDGVVSATTATLPSVEDAASAKTFVTSVSEDKGQIAVTKGTITSTGETIVLTDNADGGVNFEVHYDGTTIIQDPETKELKVAGSALIQYEGDDDTVQISAPANNVRTVSSPLTISATTPSEANVKEQYNLVGASGNTIGATIKIYKDSALLSVALLHADYSDPSDPVLPTYDKATNTWTDIADPTDENQALCYAYEDVEGTVVVAAVPVGSFINEQEFASGVTWDATANKVKGVVDGTSEGFLTVGADGFKLSGVQNAIDDAVATAVSGLDATVTAETANGHVSVQIDEVDGKLTAVTLTEDNIANADDLAELSGKTITAITSNNASITATIDEAVGNKSYNIETDASKIKMSGFTSTDALSGITASSSITEAFKEVDRVITENEQTIAAALTDLDDRIETVSGDVETLSAKTITSVTVNNNAVTVANGVAPISITAATSAATATSTEAIVVNTDANGNITLGIANIDCGYYDGTNP